MKLTFAHRVLAVWPLAVACALGPWPLPAARGATATGPEHRLTAQQRSALGTAFLASGIEALQTLKRPGEFTKFALARLNERDREEMRPYANEIRNLDVQQIGNEFIFRDGTGAVTISWPSFPDKRLIVDGINWDYKPQTSLRSQMLLLQKRLSLKERHAFLRLLEPRADAWGAVALSAASLLYSVISSAPFLEGVCSFIETKGAVEQYTFCNSYVAQQIIRNEAKRIKQGVKVEIAAKKTVDSDEETTFWKPVVTNQCPSEKTANTYVALIQPVTFSGGKPEKWLDSFTIRVDLQDDGTRAKSGFTAAPGTDMTKPDAGAKALTTFAFDENGLKSFDVPNPHPRTPGDPTWKPTVTVDMSVDDSKLDPFVKGRRDQMTSMLKAISVLINACVAQSQKQKIEDKQNSGPRSAPAPKVAPSTEPASAVQ